MSGHSTRPPLSALDWIAIVLAIGGPIAYFVLIFNLHRILGP